MAFIVCLLSHIIAFGFIILGMWIGAQAESKELLPYEFIGFALCLMAAAVVMGCGKELSKDLSKKERRQYRDTHRRES